MLSVFNTGAKYRMVPAGFDADAETLFGSGAFLGEMVLVLTEQKKEAAKQPLYNTLYF